MKCKNGHTFDKPLYQVLRPSIIEGNLIADPEDAITISVCPICKVEIGDEQ
ncbi:hypothetical protein KAT51_08115 [bacterium]|nr:hypothetical protein [bacterium]